MTGSIVAEPAPSVNKPIHVVMKFPGPAAIHEPAVDM